MQVKNYRAKRKSAKNVQLAFFGIILLASNTSVYFYAKSKGAADATTVNASTSAVVSANALSSIIESSTSDSIDINPHENNKDNDNDNDQQEQQWKVDQLPIMKSISDGFHPIYVYSTVNKSVRRNDFSQVKQDRIILALSRANDAKATKESTTSTTTTTTSTITASSKFFVDLAANHALELSNTYRLEKSGWNGLCIEPNPIYWYNLAAYRKCTIVGSFVGGTPSQDGKEVDVVLSNGVFGGIANDGMDNKPKEHAGKMEKRNLVSIQTVFRNTNVPSKIDYFSLDVERAESIVMADFPWKSYSFKFITIERPKDDLIHLLVRNGYKKALNITDWGETLWVNTKEVLLTQEEIEDIVKQYPNAHSVVK